MIRELWKYLTLVVLITLVIIGGKWLSRWEKEEYVISAGNEGAGYHQFASKLAKLGEKPSVGLRLSVIESAGSEQNLGRLVKGEVDFALVQQGRTLDDNVRAVAEIYRDIVHILVRNDSGISEISDFKGKKFSIGPNGSGTQIVSRQLLQHYMIAEKEMTLQNWVPQRALQGLLKGEIDGMILVTSMRAPVIEKAMHSGLVHHLSLGEADNGACRAHGICSRYRHLQPTVIPPHAYGRGISSRSVLPEKALTVLSIPSFLMCREDVHEGAVHAVTKAIFGNRYAFDSDFAMGSLREPKDLESFVYPLHDGADKYYRRKDPGFLVLYAEVIAMLLSVSIALVGIVSALRRWVALRRKNRIDVYYATVNEIWKRLKNETITELELEEKKLIDLRYQAFDELIDERLTADESFRIFQDLLEQCLQELARQRKAKSESL